MRRPTAILAALLALSTATAFATSGKRIPPIFTRQIVTLPMLYATASTHIRDEMLRPVGAPPPTTIPRISMPWDRRPVQPKRLNARALAHVPAAKRYVGPRVMPRFRAYDVGATTIQMIAMGRFSDTDCTLYPYVFTLQYAPATGALVQENSVVATPAVAQSNGLPMSEQIC